MYTFSKMISLLHRHVEDYVHVFVVMFCNRNVGLVVPVPGVFS